LTQILVNLLGNAVKFTPSGGAVGLETYAGTDNQLHIAVWDTGVGIPESEQRKIFDQDYRAPQSNALNKVPGLGLGLAISRDLARKLDGDITVVSQPGQGSRFTLSLPLAPESA
jgi:signal transduction histidine kinase